MEKILDNESGLKQQKASKKALLGQLCPKLFNKLIQLLDPHFKAYAKPTSSNTV